MTEGDGSPIPIPPRASPPSFIVASLAELAISCSESDVAASPSTASYTVMSERPTLRHSRSRTAVLTFAGSVKRGLDATGAELVPVPVHVAVAAVGEVVVVMVGAGGTVGVMVDTVSLTATKTLVRSCSRMRARRLRPREGVTSCCASWAFQIDGDRLADADDNETSSLPRVSFEEYSSSASPSLVLCTGGPSVRETRACTPISRSAAFSSHSTRWSSDSNWVTNACAHTEAVVKR